MSASGELGITTVTFRDSPDDKKLTVSPETDMSGHSPLDRLTRGADCQGRGSAVKLEAESCGLLLHAKKRILNQMADSYVHPTVCIIEFLNAQCQV